MARIISGRKYGLGKYGASSYDLGVAHEVPPWVPITPDPEFINSKEIWKPVPTPYAPLNP